MALFKSYLTNRSQSVFYKGEYSDTILIDSGVLQGSVLGPGLFFMMMNDLPFNIDSKCILFADDITFYATGN